MGDNSSGGRKLSDVRFEAGERRRAALEVALSQGLGLVEALALVGMSRGAYQKGRSKYRGWAARWDVAKLSGRSGGLAEDAAGVRAGPLHVPASFEGFVERFFPDRGLPQAQHLMLAAALAEVRPREVVLFLLWPGAGKSAVVEDYICRRLALDPDHRFRVVSSNADHAERMVGTCKRRFTDVDTYPDFLARFGPFYESGQERSGKPWSAREVTVWKSSGGERDRSLKASGWKAATLGSRIDTLIWDDVQTPENFSEAEKIFYRLRSTYFSRGKSLRTVIVGNRCGPGDLYDRMEDAGLITRRVIIPATGALGAEQGAPSVPDWWFDESSVHQAGGPCCGGLVPFRDCPDDGVPLSPQEFVDMTRHTVGDQAWYSLYLQNPIHSSLSTFGASLDACLVSDRRAGDLVPA